MISATAGNVVNGASMEDTPTSERRSVPNPAAEKYMFYVRIAVFFSVIVITCYGVILIQCFSLLLLLHSHRAYRAYIRVTEQIFGSIIMIVTYLLCPGTKLVVTGDFDRIRARGKSIMISNHQIYPDWFYLWAFTWLRGCHGDLKIMLIEWLKYLPIFGQGMWFFEFIFMKQKWEKDKDNMQKHLLKAKDPASPLMLLIFPEGTLNTPENIKKSQAYAKKMGLPRHPRHMLLPKSTGLHFCATTLMPEVDDLFDLTVGYSGLRAGQIPYDEYLVDKVFFRGSYPKEVHIHVKAHSLRTIPGLDGKGSEAEQADAFTTWLRDVFYEKDDRMERFYTTGSLLDDAERLECPRLLAKAAPELQDWVVVAATWYAMWKLTPLYAWAIYWAVLWPLSKSLSFGRDQAASTLSFLAHPVVAMSQISINVALAVMAVVPVVATVKVILHYVLVSNNYHVPTLAQQVRGKHILVTGASKGLGKAIAIELAKAGADVTLMARGQDRDAEGKSSLDHAANECRAAAAKVSSKQHTPGTIRTAAVDAGRYEEVVEKVREVVREAGAHPYWIIANAGGATPGFLADQTNVMGWNAVDSMMTQNYMTAVNVVRAALVVAKEVGKLGAGAKVADDRGRSAKPWSIVGLKGQEQVAFPARVVLVGSVLSVMSFIGYSSYSASKYALRGLADGLRSEFAAIKTRVHMYLPANMDTPGFAKENETKPKITAQIEGTASTMTAEKAGQVLLGGVLNERYFITNDILGELIRVVSHGPAPRPNPVTEALALPFISLILSIWVYFSDWDVSSHFSKAPAVEAKKDKKNK